MNKMKSDSFLFQVKWRRAKRDARLLRSKSSHIGDDDNTYVNMGIMRAQTGSKMGRDPYSWTNVHGGGGNNLQVI